jgi:hypothetical protein
MMRYFFDLRDGDELAVDEEGVELPNMQRVQEEAASSLAELARGHVLEAVTDGANDMAIEVRDEDGPLMKVTFLFGPDRVRH